MVRVVSCVEKTAFLVEGGRRRVGGGSLVEEEGAY